MKLVRLIGGLFVVAMLAVALSLYAHHTAIASDHQDSPTVVANPLEDITDVFLFPAPDTPGNIVFVMDVDPLIPAGQYQSQALDPNVLYQFKIANNIANSDPKEHVVMQLKANSQGTGQTITLYGPAAPNEQSTTNTIITSTGTVPFNRATTLSNGIKVFVGPRRDPFFFDLAQFFKILPDRNYKNQPNPPAATASSFNFASASQPIVLNGTSYGTAGSNGCSIATPSDLLANFDVLSIVVSVPKAMLEPSGAALGKIGVWATAATLTGQ